MSFKWKWKLTRNRPSCASPADSPENLIWGDDPRCCEIWIIKLQLKLFVFQVTWWRFSKLLSLDMLDVLWRCRGGNDLLWCCNTDCDDCGEIVLTLQSCGSEQWTLLVTKKMKSHKKNFEPQMKNLQTFASPFAALIHRQTTLKSFQKDLLWNLDFRLSPFSLVPLPTYSSRSDDEQTTFPMKLHSSLKISLSTRFTTAFDSRSKKARFIWHSGKFVRFNNNLSYRK